MAKIGVVAVAFLLISSCAGACGNGFAEDMASRIRAAYPDAKVDVVDGMTLRVSARGVEGLQMNLHNLNARCESDPPSCNAAKQQMVASLGETLANLTQTPSLESLRATIRAKEWLENAAPGGKEEDRPLSRPFLGDMAIVYVFDLPTTMRALTPSDRERLGLAPDALHERAIKNLDALAACSVAPIPPGSRVMSLTAGDSYEVSRLLMKAPWASLAKTVEGDLLAAAPARDEILFTGAANPADVAELQRRVEETFSLGEHAVSRAILRYAPDSPDGWLLFSPR